MLAFAPGRGYYAKKSLPRDSVQPGTGKPPLPSITQPSPSSTNPTTFTTSGTITDIDHKRQLQQVIGGDSGPGNSSTPKLTPKEAAIVRKLGKVRVDRIKIVFPVLAIEAAARAKLPLTLALAMLSQESTGGHNEWGHDTNSIFANGVDTLHNKKWGDTVTKASYLAYRSERDRTGNTQGVGPTQITLAAYQNEADSLGGAWKPLPNMIVGFGVLEGSIKQYRLFNGLAAYNAGPAHIDSLNAKEYATSVLAFESAWAKQLGLKSVQQ